MGVHEFKKEISFLELVILNTISFYDVMKMPVSIQELHSCLYISALRGEQFSLRDITTSLETSAVLQKCIGKKEGYYFLKDSSHLVSEKKKRYRITDQKMKRARRFVSWARYIPFIKSICVCNNVAFFNANDKSDIDIFVIAREGRIFIVRLSLMVLSIVLGYRVRKGNDTDKMCLSFFVTEKELNLESISLDGDVYLAHWLSWLIPLYGVESYNDFYKANTWIERYVPNRKRQIPSERIIVRDSRFTKFVKSTKESFYGGIIGDMVEIIAKKVQYLVMSKHKKELGNDETNNVVISDSMLKFHLDDQRKQFQELHSSVVSNVIQKI